MNQEKRPYEALAQDEFGRPQGGLRRRLYAVIFEADTPAGRRFDIGLVAAILLSILAVVLDSVPSIGAEYDRTMHALEWIFTLLFSAEYLARLACVRQPLRYAASFYGIIDLLSVLPTYLSLLVPGTALLLDIRILRLLRVFRIFKLTLYVEEFTRLSDALSASRRKIMVFLAVVLMAILILGTVMYVVEGPRNGYTSIPVAMYWATVTMTTVGYGDITPHTNLGKLVASFMMLLGWGILAVPTGIVTAEMTAQGFARRARQLSAARRCQACGSAGHEPAARFCKDCGAPLTADSASADGQP
jgi:voltage-gated potassium channel